MYSSKPAIIVPGCGADTLAIKQRIFELDTIARGNSTPADHMIEELNKIYNLKINEYNRIKTNNAELPKWKNL
jgi:hypothetical protein